MAAESPDQPAYGAGLRVFHIHLGKKGGAENFFKRLVGALHDRGVAQMALTEPDRLWHAELPADVEVLTGTFSASHFKRMLAQRWVRKRAKGFSANVVMAWMAPAGRLVPKRLPGVAKVMRLGDFPDKLAPLENCEQIVGITPEILDRAVNIGWPHERTKLIGNFVDPVTVDPIPRSEIGFDEDRFLIVAMGRFVQRKGFDTLLEALRHLPNADLLLLGDGQRRAAYERFVEKHNLHHRVRMPGWVPDTAPYVRAADCLCFPSNEEPLGNVTLEGWASGVPVVATDAEGPAWIIDNGETGLVTPKGDGEALAAAIGRLRDRNLAAKLVAGAAKRMREDYSAESISRQYIDWFRELLDAKTDER